MTYNLPFSIQGKVLTSKYKEAHNIDTFDIAPDGSTIKGFTSYIYQVVEWAQSIKGDYRGNLDKGGVVMEFLLGGPKKWENVSASQSIVREDKNFVYSEITPLIREVFESDFENTPLLLRNCTVLINKNTRHANITFLLADKRTGGESEVTTQVNLEEIVNL